MRREHPSQQTSIHDMEDEPVGRSYTAQPVDTTMTKQYEARARRFLLLALVMQVGLIALVYYREAVMARLMPLELEGAAAQRFPLMVLGAYVLLVMAYGLAKTSETMGAGFWGTFAMSLLPPLWPAVGARMGGRSVVWAYIYLALDALVMSLAWRFLDSAPLVLGMLLVVMLPLAAYHLTGCAMGTIAMNLGVNSYAAVIWLCMAPLAYVFYQASQMGLAVDFINALIEPDVTLEGGALRALVDPSQVVVTYSATVMAGVWLVIGWLFWLKSVYESLRYPLF